MRIWILTSEFGEEIAGGIARYTDTFSRLLADTGHEVTILTRSDKPKKNPAVTGVNLITVIPPNIHLKEINPLPEPDTHPAYPYNILDYWSAFSWQLARETINLLKTLQPPDIIESQEYAAIPYYLIQRKLTETGPITKIPILVHLHSATFDLTKLNHGDSNRFPLYWTGQMEKFCIQAADGLLSPSRFMARHIQAELNPTASIDVIPLPLTEQNEFNKSDLVNPPSKNRIVYVGRLEIRKGVLPLLKACSRLWSSGWDFQLEMVGGDTAYPAQNTTVAAFIREQAGKWIKSGHLLLPGQLDQAGTLTRIRSARAVVVPSLWENFPNVCMEAMNQGQVVLVSSSGGQAEMVERNGENGLIFDWEQPGSFEAKLDQALHLSKTEHSGMGVRARARIREMCSPQHVLQQRLEHYERLIAAHAGRRVFPVPAGTRAAHPGLARVRQKAPEETAALLSIVIPFHNLEAYLPEALQSVEKSTYSPSEIIVVDDGSDTEDSLSLLRQIENRQDVRLRIIHTPNNGLAAARNTGARAAGGEWVTFLDADDRVEPTYYQRAADVLKRYSNVDFVYSWERFFGGETGIWPTWNAEFPYLLGHNMLPAFAVVRRQVFLRFALNKPEVGYSLEDFESWISLLEAGGVGISLPDPLVCYRVRPGSMLRKANPNQRRYLYDLISQLHPDLYREYGRELFNLQNANGPAWCWNHPGLEMQENSPDYIRDLEDTRDRLWQEVQTLGAAWQEQDRFIKHQNERIAGLEEIIGVPGFAAGALLGGRLERCLRQQRLVRLLLRLPGLKPFLKRWINRL